MTATRHSTVPRSQRTLIPAGCLALGLAIAGGCGKTLPPQEPNADTIEPPPRVSTIREIPPLPVASPSPSPSPASGESGAVSAAAAPEAGAGRVVVVHSGRQVGSRISTYYLSPGDEIRVSVYGHADLSRTVRIPPDGHMFFPMVGDIPVDGMSIPELRQVLADRLKTATEQKIGTGDQVIVRVYRNEDLSMTTMVPSSGRVTLPLAGEVELSGLTVEAANRAIAEKLANYVVRPSVSTTIQRAASGLPGPIMDAQVSVEVLTFGGHKILVLGEVKNPGVYVNEGGSRLIDIVARAGGPTDSAKLKNVALIRPATETSPPRAAVLDLDRAIKSGGLDQNPPVQRGDVVYVPRSTIANVTRFFEQLYTIVRPFVAVESGIWLGQNIEAGTERVPSTILFTE